MYVLVRCPNSGVTCTCILYTNRMFGPAKSVFCSLSLFQILSCTCAAFISKQTSVLVMYIYMYVCSVATVSSLNYMYMYSIASNIHN